MATEKPEVYDQAPFARKELFDLVREMRGLRKERGPFCVDLGDAGDIGPLVLTNPAVIMDDDGMSTPRPDHRSTVYVVMSPRGGYIGLEIKDAIWVSGGPMNSGQESVYDYRGTQLSESLSQALRNAAINNMVLTGGVTYNNQGLGRIITIGDMQYNEFGGKFCRVTTPSQSSIEDALSSSLALAHTIRSGQYFADELKTTAVVRKALGIEK